MSYRPPAETLVACAWFPAFPIQVERWRRPECRNRPVVLLTQDGKPAAAACSAQAHRLGVRTGMPLREILATAPHAVLLPEDEAGYREISLRIAQTLETITPQVEISEPGALFLGLEGLVSEELPSNGTALPSTDGSRLYDSPRTLLEQLEAVTETPMRARIGVARGKFVARMAAHRPRPLEGVLQTERSLWLPDRARRPFLRALPAELLAMSPATRRKLELFGLRSMGEIADLKLPAMLAQFGREGRRIWMLAQGTDEEPLRPLTHEAALRETLQFSPPETLLEPLRHAARQLLESALNRRERRGRGVRQACLEAGLESGITWILTASYRQPATLPDRLLPPLLDLLERRPPPAAVETLTLTLTALTASLNGQGSLFREPEQERRERLLQELRNLSTRVGRMPVSRIVAVDPHSRLPERRYSLISFEP